MRRRNNSLVGIMAIVTIAATHVFVPESAEDVFMMIVIIVFLLFPRWSWLGLPEGVVMSNTSDERIKKLRRALVSARQARAGAAKKIINDALEDDLKAAQNEATDAGYTERGVILTRRTPSAVMNAHGDFLMDRAIAKPTSFPGLHEPVRVLRDMATALASIEEFDGRIVTGGHASLILRLADHPKRESK